MRGEAPKRTGKVRIRISIFIICWLGFGAGFTNGGLGAEGGDRAGYRAQAAGGPVGSGQSPPETAAPLPPDKTRRQPDRKEPPAAPSKSGPLKPFEPTEKVRADQALDFPADI
jgi:hypothetical protein